MWPNNSLNLTCVGICVVCATQYGSRCNMESGLKSKSLRNWNCCYEDSNKHSNRICGYCESRSSREGGIKSRETKDYVRIVRDVIRAKLLLNIRGIECFRRQSEYFPRNLKPQKVLFFHFLIDSFNV